MLRLVGIKDGEEIPDPHFDEQGMAITWIPDPDDPQSKNQLFRPNHKVTWAKQPPGVAPRFLKEFTALAPSLSYAKKLKDVISETTIKELNKVMGTVYTKGMRAAWEKRQKPKQEQEAVITKTKLDQRKAEVSAGLSSLFIPNLTSFVLEEIQSVHQPAT